MQRYFSGRVDHIRSAVVDAQIGLSTVRSLFLYDAVPGGSGYLRQLADNTGAMKAVIQVHLTRLIAVLAHKKIKPVAIDV